MSVAKGSTVNARSPPGVACSLTVRRGLDSGRSSNGLRRRALRRLQSPTAARAARRRSQRGVGIRSRGVGEARRLVHQEPDHGDIRNPRLSILLEATLDDRSTCGGVSCRQCAPIRARHDDCGDHSPVTSSPSNSPPSREHLEQHDSRRPRCRRACPLAFLAPARAPCRPRCRGSARRVAGGLSASATALDSAASTARPGADRFGEAEVEHLHGAVGVGP